MVLEVAAEVILVANQDLSRLGGNEFRFGVEQVQQRLTLVGLRFGQGEADRQSLERARQVQAQPPEKRLRLPE
ncbi:hypothetical protein E0500_029330 [Streptomyces sp. KM273126]|uniref:hypothetical protein n=1 Tax=Streptomyces sp. KM273126 TaxID=2545247 RepID=UPI00104087A0|nr:hypothetical protein [Streptomyces sp. KM273126]MBA2811347.1 hypothetical protein [Streptomyces sp. KM273126]